MIGKLIYEVYYNNADSFTDVNGMFPSVAPITDDFPFIVYDVLDVEPSPTKDSPTSAMDTYAVNFMVFAKKYEGAQTIGERIKYMLDTLEPGSIGELSLQSCRFQAEDDDYNDEMNAYINTVNYKFRINKANGLDFTTPPAFTFTLPTTLA